MILVLKNINVDSLEPEATILLISNFRILREAYKSINCINIQEIYNNKKESFVTNRC